MQTTGESGDHVSDVARHRRVRKSRGRGLRTAAGCKTCRSRRVKVRTASNCTQARFRCTNPIPQCDESKPVCSVCIKSRRTCIYSAHAGVSERGSALDRSAANNEATSGRQQRLQHAKSTTSDVLTAASGQLASLPSEKDCPDLTVPQSRPIALTAYGSNTASTRWFGLLAHDAAEIDLELPGARPSDAQSHSEIEAFEPPEIGETVQSTVATDQILATTVQPLSLIHISEPTRPY